MRPRTLEDHLGGCWRRDWKLGIERDSLKSEGEPEEVEELLGSGDQGMCDVVLKHLQDFMASSRTADGKPAMSFASLSALLQWQPTVMRRIERWW